jgi:uncharacterized SAM-binding protein YcdF (DUF218 family)
MPAELQLLLSKIAPMALLPEGLVILALIGAILGLMRRAVRLAGMFAFAALLTFWVSAMPVVANWLTGTLERQYASAPAALPHAEIAIVLGGGVGAPAPPRQTPELFEAADRVWYAAHLYRTGHVKRIIAVGGQLPWEEASRPEGEVMRDMLITLGVPAEAIEIGTTSRNTYENAMEARTIMRGPPFGPVLLVTSAAHMPRALAVFRAADILVDPAPCDFRSSNRHTATVVDWLPQAGAFAMTSSALREWMGYYAYRWRGWL